MKARTPKTSGVKGKEIHAKPKEFNLNDFVSNSLSKDEVQEFKTAFDMFDCDSEGCVGVAEIKQAFINLGFHHQSPNTEKLFSYLGTIHNGRIDFGEFLRLVTDRINQNFSQDQTDLVFSAFDYKNTGKFNIHDLRDAIRDIGADYDEEEIDRMFENADADEDGLVTREDFYNIISRKV